MERNLGGSDDGHIELCVGGEGGGMGVGRAKLGGWVNVCGKISLGWMLSCNWNS